MFSGKRGCHIVYLKSFRMKKTTFLNKVISFVANSLRSSSSESSKRLFGAIGFITAIIYIAVWDHNLIEALLYVSAALLGLGSITSVFKKK
jgi:hypothetical protein